MPSLKQSSSKNYRRRWGDLSWIRNRKGAVVAVPLAAVVMAITTYVGMNYVGGGHAAATPPVQTPVVVVPTPQCSVRPSGTAYPLPGQRLQRPVQAAGGCRGN